MKEEDSSALSLHLVFCRREAAKGRIVQLHSSDIRRHDQKY